jgi:hypothetical protein
VVAIHGEEDPDREVVELPSEGTEVRAQFGTED